MATETKPRAAHPEADLSLRIRETAYYHWQERGGPHGSALEDWLYAERLILDAADGAETASVGPAAGSKAERAASSAAVKPKAHSGSRAAVPEPPMKKASPAAVARAKAESGAESVPAKPKKKAIPKVKKSAST